MSITLEKYEKLSPYCEIQHLGHSMKFSTPSTMTRWRVESIYKKEPWTLEWISSFHTDEILLDCGANVGMYTIWAAVTKGVSVYAFEPESQNYAVLNRNILFNNLTSNVKAYCMGLSNKSGLFDLHMSDMRIGGSCHAVGEALDAHLTPTSPIFRQGCIAYTLDELVTKDLIPLPNHIKIDVDGFEHRVIEGARNTLKNPKVKSVLIETNQNLEEHRTMVQFLNSIGLQHDLSQVKRAERKDGFFKGVAEYVFRR